MDMAKGNGDGKWRRHLMAKVPFGALDAKRILGLQRRGQPHAYTDPFHFLSTPIHCQEYPWETVVQRCHQARNMFSMPVLPPFTETLSRPVVLCVIALVFVVGLSRIFSTSILKDEKLPDLPIALLQEVPNEKERIERYMSDTRELLIHGYRTASIVFWE